MTEFYIEELNSDVNSIADKSQIEKARIKAILLEYLEEFENYDYQYITTGEFKDDTTTVDLDTLETINEDDFLKNYTESEQLVIMHYRIMKLEDHIYYLEEEMRYLEDELRK